MPLNYSAIQVTPPAGANTVDSLEISLFRNHLLIPRHPLPKLHFTPYDFSIAGVVFLIYMIVVLVYVRYRKRLNQVVNAFYINRYANQLLREEASVVNRLSVLLSIVFLLSITLFTMQLMAYYGWQVLLPSGALFLTVAAGYVLLYVVKFSSIKFLAHVFKISKVMDEYVLTIVLFLNTLGLFLLPLVVLIAFSGTRPTGVFILSGLCISALFFLVRIARGLSIGLNNPRVSTFYLFLYLCTFEILPLVVLLKFFLRTIS